MVIISIQNIQYVIFFPKTIYKFPDINSPTRHGIYNLYLKDVFTCSFKRPLIVLR